MLKTITLITMLSALGVFPVDSTAFADDFTVVFRTSNKVSGGPAPAPDQKSTEYHSDTKIRVIKGDNDRIEDFARGRVITIDHAMKRYYDNSQQELLTAMQEKLEAQFRALEKIGGKTPELATLKAIAGAGDASIMSVKRLPSSRKILGYECKGAVYTIRDMGTVTVWATTALPTPKSSNVTTLSANPLLGQGFRNASEEMRRSLEGFALSIEARIEVQGRRVETVTEAVEVRREIIPPATFAPPPGYTRGNGLPENLLALPVKPK